jgi:hypothetical protein
MLGAFGEVLLGNVYNAVFGNPLWAYRVLQVHNAYTSKYSPIIWGVLGFHVYLLHGTLRDTKRWNNVRLSILFAAETIIIELIGNFSFHIAFHRYIFYYFPGDLWHYTSLQTLPLYFVAGLVLTRSIQKLRSDPLFFTVMAVGLTSILVFLT